LKANDIDVIDSMRGDISADKISFKANNKQSSKTTLNKEKTYRLANSKLILIKYTGCPPKKSIFRKDWMIFNKTVFEF
jgi:hypothetical protein